MGVGSKSVSESSAIDVELGVKAIFECDHVDGIDGRELRFGLAGYEDGPAMVCVDRNSKVR
jgi:hypothetical protein